MPWLLKSYERDAVLIVQETGWVSGPIWMGLENLTPNGVRTPDHPAHGDSLYKVHYPGQQISTTFFKKTRQNYDDDDDNDNNKSCVKQRSMPQGSKTQNIWNPLLINYIYHTKDLYIVTVVFIHTNLQNPSNNVSLVQ
jgi:hypothetical protein